MLGEISPQTIRIVPRAVVYPGRDNIVQLAIQQHTKRGIVPVVLDTVTRIVLVLPQMDPVVAFDSTAAPEAITWAGSAITLDLSAYAMPATSQRCYLIAYDADHPDGVVLVDDADAVLTLSFRNITASGTLPPPTVDLVLEAPTDGARYLRQNGDWVPLAEAGGVASFNGRTGVVVLTSDDIVSALGFTPATAAQGAKADSAVQPGALAAVATSGAYADLSGVPAIPATPGDVGAATAAQGALAETAVQPQALADELALKVDKVAGKQLSDENYTSAEKAKLAGLEGSHYRGTFVNLAALQAAIPSAAPGDYADVDAGAGSPVLRYLWDADDGWTAQAGSADPITAAQVKTLYESNPDTNPFSDAEKSKLAGVADGATANASTDSLAEGAANLYHTAARVRGVVLTGLSLVANRAIQATDSVLVALGLLQAQATALASSLANKVDVVAGKQLSTEDYTTAEKDKLASLAPAGTWVQLTQAEYDALVTKDPDTLYIVVG